MKVAKVDGDIVSSDDCAEVLWKPRLAGIQFKAYDMSACH